MLRASAPRKSVGIAIALVIFSAGWPVSQSAAGEDASSPIASASRPRRWSVGPTGTLTARGTVTINGNRVETGATVLSGSTVATGPDGSATLDLGGLGRIELGSNTTVTLTFAPSSIEVRVGGCALVTQSVPPGVASKVIFTSDNTRLAVNTGQLDVQDAGRSRALAAGESGTFGARTVASSSGGSAFRVEATADCRQPAGAPPPVVAGGGFPDAGWYAIAGGAIAATAAGIAAANDGDAPVSPFQP